jgi:uncharacterized membrane protein
MDFMAVNYLETLTFQFDDINQVISIWITYINLLAQIIFLGNPVIDRISDWVTQIQYNPG